MVCVVVRVLVGFAEADRELLNEGVKVFVGPVVRVPVIVATAVPEFV
jgi:hydrogenase-4 membrane subunit HyfE